MKIIIRTIPHDAQRYDTCGDWLVDKDHNGDPYMMISVSDLGDWRKEFLIGIHEMVETALCLHDGVDEESVSAFDVAYEAKRRFQLTGAEPSAEWDPRITPDSEPGDHPDAPYQRQHGLATAVERMMAPLLGVKWAEYEDSVLGLCYHGANHADHTGERHGREKESAQGCESHETIGRADGDGAAQDRDD